MWHLRFVGSICASPNGPYDVRLPEVCRSRALSCTSFSLYLAARMPGPKPKARNLNRPWTLNALSANRRSILAVATRRKCPNSRYTCIIFLFRPKPTWARHMRVPTILCVESIVAGRCQVAVSCCVRISCCTLFLLRASTAGGEMPGSGGWLLPAALEALIPASKVVAAALLALPILSVTGELRGSWEVL